MAAIVEQSNADTLAPGYQLDTYRIETVLGQGGFGITYRAQDTKLGADVAIKEYFPQSYSVRQDRSTIVPRTSSVDAENYRWGLSEFLKEAQALARFKHPHIVRVLRFFEGNGTAYMVMEYEKGETLSGFLKHHGGFLDEATLLRIFLPVLGGLQAVHDAELLHLDIKPENIYLRGDGTPMLIDFGSARQLRGDESQKIMLTPGYAALEQYPGHGDIGAWSDVYSIGATLYRCVTSQMPIDSLARYETFKRNRMDPLRPATSLERPSYAPHIRKCIDAALSLSSGDRPTSAYILQQGLMGKDMSLVGKPMRQTVYKPGAGFLGVLPTATVEKTRRFQRPTLERVVALLVFAATFFVVTPKILVDTGYMTGDEVYALVEDRKERVKTLAYDIGAFINEKIFMQAPRPRVIPVRLDKMQPKTLQAAPATAEAPVVPFGTDKRLLKEIVIPEGTPIAAGFLKHGATLAVATDEGLTRLWDVPSGEMRVTLSTNVRTPYALADFASSQWIAASNREDAIVLFDPLGNSELTLTNDPPYAIVAMAASPANRLIAEASDTHVVSIWDPFQNRKLHKLESTERGLRVLAFSTDEKILAAGSNSGGITFWETDSGKQLALRTHHAGAVTALKFSEDGIHLASGDERGYLLLWDVKSGANPKPLPDSPQKISGLAFSPDGKWLVAVGTENSVGVWNVETGERADKWQAHAKQIVALAVSTDGRYIATVGNDNLVRIWE